MNASHDVARDSEQETRVNVAAGYRLVHMYGLSDFTDGFVSARIPGARRDFVVGGYGMFPEHLRASHLFRRNLDAHPVQEKAGVDLDAFRFSRASFNARGDIGACIHAHPKAIIALSGIDVGLLPLSQWGIMYGGCVAYTDYVTTDVTEEAGCNEIDALLKQGIQAIIQRKHGILAVGKDVAQAFFTLHRIELACELQLRTMSTGGTLRMPSPELTAQLMQSYWTMTRVDHDGSREWPGLLEKLDRQHAASPATPSWRS